MKIWTGYGDDRSLRVSGPKNELSAFRFDFMNKPTTKTLATKYRVSTRTIRNWKRDGAPLGDAAKMKHWLAARRTAPTPAENGKDRSQNPGPPRPPGNPGAPAALRRLEQAELEGYQRLQEANASNDATRIKSALGAYLSVSEALRKADVSVSEQRRDAQETVPRATVQAMLSGLGWSIRLGLDETADAIAARLCPNDRIHASGQLREAYGSLLLTSLAGLRSSVASTGIAWPAWMLEALSEDPARSFVNGLDNLAQRTRLLSAAYKAGCGQRDELDKLLEELEA